MAIDLTKERLKCPLSGCEETFTKRRELKQHINEASDNTHKGRQGQVVLSSRTVETVTDPNFSSTEQFNKKVELAKEKGYVDEFNNETIKKIADEADVYFGRVIRALEEKDIDYSWKGRAVWKFKQLTGSTPDVLIMYAEADVPPYDEWKFVEKDGWNRPENDNAFELLKQIGENTPTDYNKAKEKLAKYHWLIDEYHDHESYEPLVDENSEHNGEVTTTSSLEDMVEAVKSDVADEGTECQTEETQEKEDTKMKLELDSEDEAFDVMLMFIENGDEEKAKKLFSQAYNN